MAHLPKLFKSAVQAPKDEDGGEAGPNSALGSMASTLSGGGAGSDGWRRGGAAGAEGLPVSRQKAAILLCGLEAVMLLVRGGGRMVWGGEVGGRW